MDKELREWLGLAPADLLIYGAIVFALLMYFLDGGLPDLAAATVAMLLCVVSCFLGMRKDPKLSGITNFMKTVSYPLCVLICAGLIFLNYWFWNS